MTDFLTLAHIKTSLSITSTNSDSKLSEIISDANAEVDKVLSPYTEAIPITDETLLEYGKYLSTIYARSRWFRDTGQLERAEKSEAEYQKKKESYVELLVSQKNSKTITTFIPGDDPAETVYQPYNVDEYITRVF